MDCIAQHQIEQCKLKDHYSKEKDQICIHEGCNYQLMCLYCRLSEHKDHNAIPIEQWKKDILFIKSPQALAQSIETMVVDSLQEIKKDILIKFNQELEDSTFTTKYDENQQLIAKIKTISARDLNSSMISKLTNLSILFNNNIQPRMSSCALSSELKSQIVGIFTDKFKAPNFKKASLQSLYDSLKEIPQQVEDNDVHYFKKNSINSEKREGEKEKSQIESKNSKIQNQQSTEEGLREQISALKMELETLRDGSDAQQQLINNLESESLILKSQLEEKTESIRKFEELEQMKGQSQEKLENIQLKVMQYDEIVQLQTDLNKQKSDLLEKIEMIEKESAERSKTVVLPRDEDSLEVYFELFLNQMMEKADDEGYTTKVMEKLQQIMEIFKSQ